MRKADFFRLLMLPLICLVVFSSCLSEAENSTPHNNSSTVSDEDVKKTLQSEIDSLESLHAQRGSKDTYVISKLISAYSNYRNEFRESPETPDIFLKGGDLAMSLGKWQKAADIFKAFHNDYPKHPYSDDALFQLGFIFDFQLKDKEKAKQTYEHYLKHYGDSIHIEDVKSRLINLDLTEEQLIEKFRKQNNLQN